jgi:hypothetical protein
LPQEGKKVSVAYDGDLLSSSNGVILLRRLVPRDG